MSAPRKGGCLQTRSGIAYYPLDPRACEVRIRDIAHSLSMLCRFNGHCNKFYSVAEHSVLVSRVVPAKHALAALLHDASEAYCSDVPTPLKLSLRDYDSIEHLNWLAIADKFGLNPELDPSVHAADMSVLIAEKAQLVDNTFNWDLTGDAACVEVLGLPPDEAFNLFNKRFLELF